MDGELDELWVVMLNYPDYAASTHGNIRRVTPSKHSRGLPLRHAIGSSGYSQVSVFSQGKRTSADVHRLVAETFLGPCPDGMEVGHKDNNRQNCRLSNLVYCTPKENHAHRMKCGKAMQGSDNTNAKMNEMIVRIIKRLPAMSLSDLASIFGVSPGAIWFVRTGRSWKHV